MKITQAYLPVLLPSVARIDDLTYYCDGVKRHLVCIPYSIVNLHRMALDLSLSRVWFHAGEKAHYDLPKTRIDEISAKCQLVNSRIILTIIKTGKLA